MVPDSIVSANEIAKSLRSNPGAEELLGLYFPVLDHGFVSLRDFMGSDESIARTARTSYGAGTKKINEDKSLIRALMRDKHTSPFEHAELQFHMKLPIFVARQMVRHRTACLSADTELWFDEPARLKTGLRKIRKMSIREFYSKWNGENQFTKRRLSEMSLRSLDENNNIIIKTNVTDIWSNGIKKVFNVIFENDFGNIYSIKMTKDHLCYTEDGWKTLEQLSGLSISRDNNVSWKNNSLRVATNGIPVYQFYDWMKEKRDAGLNVTQISEEAGCSYHTIRKWLRIHKLQFTPKEVAKFSSATQKGTKRGPLKNERKPLSIQALENIRKARSGSASNFWKGGVSTDRENIGRWTIENAVKTHKKYNYKCVVCECTNCKLTAHHLDPVWHNSELSKNIDNLVSLCERCHKYIHSHNLEILFLDYFNKNKSGVGFEFDGLYLPRPNGKKKPSVTKLRCMFSKIKKIELIGEEEVFDLSVSGPYHNFVANGVVVHNSLNEISGRYSVMSLQFYTPEIEEVRPQSKTNKQGRSEDSLESGCAEWFIEELTNSRENISKIYKKAIESDIAREISRIDLPLSTYTEWVWKMDLHNLFHFLKLRCDAHAQKEIVAFAKVMAGITKRCFPLAFDAWIDYQQHAENFSRQELQLLRMGSQTEQDGINLGMSKREFSDFVRKTTKELVPENFDLDLSLAKTPQFFEKERDKYVPVVK